MSLSEEEKENLWQAYLEHPSLHYVAKTCGVSPATVKRYRDSEHFDERRQKINDKNRAIADGDDNNIVHQRATEIERIHEINLKMAESFLERLESGNYKPTIKDYDRLVRLEFYLRDLNTITENHGFTFEWLDDDEEDEPKTEPKPEPKPEPEPEPEPAK